MKQNSGNILLVVVVVLVIGVLVATSAYLFFQNRDQQAYIVAQRKAAEEAIKQAYYEQADNAELPELNKPVGTCEPTVYPAKFKDAQTYSGVTVEIGKVVRGVHTTEANYPSKTQPVVSVLAMVRLAKSSRFSQIYLSRANFVLDGNGGNLGQTVSLPNCPQFPDWQEGDVILKPGEFFYGWVNYTLGIDSEKLRLLFQVETGNPKDERFLEFGDVLGFADLSEIPVTGKPVIYLYPTQPTDISVKLNYLGTLVTTYPKYNLTVGGWNVRAWPDGKIVDQTDGNEYSYIFWDGISDLNNFPIKEGFVVEGNKSQEFLQEILPKMGLIPKEYNEFIAYWLPKLEKNKFNLIYFSGKEYEQMAKLEITPRPDSILRVYMAYQPLEEKVNIPKQQIIPFVRKGFTVVEWGGREIE